ncbi:hypothetical protein [Asticcacaulis machinosus]|uniref:Uncharacterized protein n=1 Tax=Asticcacaulis machinosus TaxID=2984211 RepID=A0ABT5HGU8_9CAUL|nr:hypothetical protein [Asticcacaulis machinosus]MDC7675408.1 hypothetical protein [Asticcacaulis machinosus]
MIVPALSGIQIKVVDSGTPVSVGQSIHFVDDAHYVLDGGTIHMTKPMLDQLKAAIARQDSPSVLTSPGDA